MCPFNVKRLFYVTVNFVKDAFYLASIFTNIRYLFLLICLIYAKNNKAVTQTFALRWMARWKYYFYIFGIFTFPALTWPSPNILWKTPPFSRWIFMVLSTFWCLTKCLIGQSLMVKSWLLECSVKLPQKVIFFA